MSVTENQYFNQLASIMKGYYYNGDFYHFYAHPYNATWTNERAVEIPIFKKLLQSVRGRVLEVGNVMSHYQSVEHPVIDLFEEAPGVLNCDVLNYNPTNRYDLIISISTIEHVGKDDEPRQEKAGEAIEHLKTLLTVGGRLVVSIPHGYNKYVDDMLPELFDYVYYLERVDQYAWRQLTYSMLKNTKYDTANGGAGVVAFAYYQRL
jgi:hypothetical protein